MWWALADDPITPAKLEGTVEVDEAYIGGKPRFKGPHTKRGHGTKQQPIVAMVQRGGDARVQVIEKVNSRNLTMAVLRNVSPSSTLITDESWAYTKPGCRFAGGHYTVKHGSGEYVRKTAYGDVATTNTVEGFFALVKRGIYGTFHSVSRHHLHRYLAEFQYRYNTRKLDDGERVSRAMRKAGGKRLRYREPATL